MLLSVELTPPQAVVSAAGVMKHVREPVLAIVGAEHAEGRLSCAAVFTHAGLVPGVYALQGGLTVRIPEGLVSDKHKASQNVTLEVVNG